MELFISMANDKGLIKKLSNATADVLEMIKNNYKRYLDKTKYSFFRNNKLGKTMMKIVALMYALPSIPDAILKKIGGKIGYTLSIIYNIIIYPVKRIVALIDPETYVSILDTVISIIWNCLAKTIFGRAIKLLMNLASKFFSIITFFRKKKKTAEVMKKREIIQEAVFKKIKDFLLKSLKKALSPLLYLAKKTMMFFFTAVHRILKIVSPLTKCISENNKLKISAWSVKSLQIYVSTGFFSGLSGKVISAAGKILDKKAAIAANYLTLGLSNFVILANVLIIALIINWAGYLFDGIKFMLDLKKDFGNMNV